MAGEQQEQQVRRKRRRFSEEFKRDAVEIVRTSDKSIAEVARELGIYDSSFGSDRIRSTEANGRVSPLMSDRSCWSCGGRTPGYRWSVSSNVAL